MNKYFCPHKKKNTVVALEKKVQRVLSIQA